MSGKKITMIVASVVVVVAVVVGAVVMGNHDNKKTVAVKTTTTNDEGQQQTQTKNVEVTKVTDIKSAVAAWKAAGFTVSNDQGAYYQMVGANKGGKYNVGETNVELYEFANNSKAEGAKTSYFTNSSDTVLVMGSLLVDIHSTDATQVAPIKAVF